MYVRVVEDWLEQKKKGMNGYERILFWLFKKNNQVGKISTQRSGVGKVLRMGSDRKITPKADRRWELTNLYFEEVHDPKQISAANEPAAVASTK